MSIDLSITKKLIAKYGKNKGDLIPILQDIQNSYGYVPPESIDLISKELKMFPVEIYGVLTFYSHFHLSKRGKHTIRVCQGTACHVMGGKEILDYLITKLKIKEGQTTKDGIFSLERVACLGCCGMAPVVQVDNDFYGNFTIQMVDEILEKYKKEGS